MDQPKNKNLEKIRHSCAHLLASSVKKLWPKAKNAIGPAIENGFYQDFDMGDVKLSENDFEKIEKKMLELLKNWDKFEIKEVTVEQAREDFADNPYKLELIEEFAKQEMKITETKQGDFLDLCKGGHSDFPRKEIKHFKLLSIAGAYWKGSEKNKMLTRIYGTCFSAKTELDNYLAMIEETKKRNHKKIGKELDLFSFHPEGPGFVFWHHKGMLLREALMSVYNNLHREEGYQIVSTPILLSEELWRKSGHWDNYKDQMYFVKIDNQTFAIKPMNCPGVSLIYKDCPRSYRDLPLRLAEQGEVHRHEPSGTLNGLFRVRAFRQDDAHLFVREDQIEKEVKDIINLTTSFYKLIGFPDYHIELSTRPEKFIGSETQWEKAEKTMKKVLEELSLAYKINEGDGAFYGPKIDFHIKDSLGRSWQCGTIQLDFFMPERFDLNYIDKDGLPKHPVMIHRTVIGSIQRFIGILIEHFGGAFPLWLAPVQVIIMPITDKQESFAKKIVEDLKTQGIRAELDNRPERLQAKIRDGSLQKVPYLGIIGDKEVQSSKSKVQNLSVRTRDGKDLGQIELPDFLKRLKEEIDKKI